ncbi:MAG TPA: methylated-DNA--[protein]-cysteine S-methyltransferase [Flavitalea sp.]|nr:methylated-DNA--[protein]-cysteine S-methyltransferase [Flavitalea sp.]
MNASDYNRIATAITFIRENFRDQPSLDDIAEQVHLSPFHFQKMFTDWAGVSPKKFLQYMSIEYAKNILREEKATLFDAAVETGLSGTGRLHDLFMTIEGMTPGEYKNGGEMLTINYSFSKTPFGNVIIASTQKGVCYLAFYDDQIQAFEELQKMFPHARYQHLTDICQANALTFFSKNWNVPSNVRLHLKGTPFQIKVWEALLKIPMGKFTTYSSIACSINNAEANRAVGSAVGDNPVAFLIPCHRVIRSSGEFGNYHWGAVRKTAMIGWEAGVL